MVVQFVLVDMIKANWRYRTRFKTKRMKIKNCKLNTWLVADGVGVVLPIVENWRIESCNRIERQAENERITAEIQIFCATVLH